MTPFVNIHDKETGEPVDRIEVEVRHHVTNYQAMIFWKGITEISYGDSANAAIQNVFEKFSSLPVLSQYDIRLTSVGG
jgi:hypothetical protein